MRLILVGEHPANHSGFSKLTHNISIILNNAFKKEGSPLRDILTIGFSRGTQDNIKTPYRLIAAGTPAVIGSGNPPMLQEDSRSGMHTLRCQLKNSSEPTIVLTIGDPWYYWYMKSYKLLYTHMRWISYTPVESDELVKTATFAFPGRIISTNIKDVYSHADKVIAYTKTGMNVIQSMIGKDICNSYIYHGIDNNELRTVTPKKFPELEGKFVVGTVCRNGFRKALDVMMIGFSAFLERVTLEGLDIDPVLLLHVPRKDSIGWNLTSLAEKLGIEDRVIISDELISSFTEVKDKSGKIIPVIKKGASIEDLVSIYKSMDCYINVSRAEGFGIPLIEAMSLEIPIAYIDFANMSEICKDKGIPIEVGGYEYKEDYEVKYAIANPKSIASVLSTIAKSKLKKDQTIIEDIVRKGKKFADSLEWSGNISTEWKNTIDDMIGITSTMKAVDQSTQQVIMISSYNTECGIAEYSKNLITELRKIDRKRIYSVIDDTQNIDSYVDMIINADRPTIVHIQYEPNLYAADKLASFVTKIKSLSHGQVKIAMTMHKEKEDNIKGLDGIVDSFILHSDQFDMINKLKYSSIMKASHPFYIIKIMNNDERNKIRTSLGFKEDQIVFGTTGFMLPYKRITEISKKLISTMEGTNRALLLPISIHRNDATSFAKKEVKNILTFAKEKGVLDRVVIKLGYHSQEELSQYLQCLDAGFMFVNSPEVGANSGSVRMMISCGVPCIIQSTGTMHKDLYGQRVSFNINNTGNPEEFIASGADFVCGHMDIAKSMRATCIQAALRNNFTSFSAAHKVQVYDRLFPVGPIVQPIQLQGERNEQTSGSI